MEYRFLPHDRAAPKREEHEEAELRSGSTSGARSALEQADDDGVADGFDCLGFESRLLPVLQETVHVLPDPLGTEEYAEFREVGPNYEHDVLVVVLGPGTEVPGSPPLEDPVHRLDVLSGH